MGDHHQLKPITLSDTAGNHLRGQLNLSLFCRLVFARLVVRMLEIQHRMHPDICALVSTVFYHGKLQDSADVGHVHREDTMFSWVPAYRNRSVRPLALLRRHAPENIPGNSDPADVLIMGPETSLDPEKYTG